MVGGGILKYGLLLLSGVFLFSLASCNNNEEKIKTIDTTTTITTTNVEEYFTVTFVNYDDSILTTVSVVKGDTAVFNLEDPKRESDDEFYYEFTGWDKDLTNVSFSFSAKAQYNKTAKVDWNEITWF